MRFRFLILALFFLFSSSAEAETLQVYVDTPNICASLQKVVEDKVYLVSGDNNCLNIAGKVAAPVDTKYVAVNVYVDGNFWQSQELVNGFDSDTIKDFLDRTACSAGAVQVPENIYKDQSGQIAAQVNNMFNSPEYKARIEQEKERIKKEVFNILPEKQDAAAADYYPDASTHQKGSVPHLAESERLYLFISSSMPVSTLRHYVADLAKFQDINIHIVMRGFVGGMNYFMPTARFVSSLLLKDPACDAASGKCETYKVSVQVDPLLFRRYDVQKVPALTYAKGVNRVAVGSEGLEDSVEIDEFYTVYGDASLRYLIDVLNVHANSPALKSIMEAMP